MIKSQTLPKLDQLDRRLLLELDRNARLPISVLAKKLREGRDRVEYRLRRLEELQIIEGYGVWVDLRMLGLELFKLYLRVDSLDDSRSELLNFLTRHRNNFWTVVCDGAWDIIAGCAFESSDAFHSFHLELLSRFNTSIVDFNAVHLISLASFARRYFLDLGATRKGSASVPTETFLWGVKGNQTIDNEDRMIISGLSRRGRIAITDLSKELGLAEHTIRSRIERLENARVIIAYRTELNLDRMGIINFKTQLFLRSYDLELRRRLREYCSENPFIIAFIEQIADANIELEIECDSHQTYHAILNDIRRQFSRLFRNFQTLVIRRVQHFRIPRMVTEPL